MQSPSARSDDAPPEETLPLGVNRSLTRRAFMAAGAISVSVLTWSPRMHWRGRDPWIPLRPWHDHARS